MAAARRLRSRRHLHRNLRTDALAFRCGIGHGSPDCHPVGGGVARMIPDDVITQIRDAADIVAVIGQHVQLRKAGRSWKGLCPFHGEKTPSFNVMPDKGFYHCFGCQKNGDVFTFIMELEGKSFVEAAEQLGNRFGIVIPRIEEPPEVRKARGERTAMLDINKIAAQFYHDLLKEPRGEPGRAYLAKRGVTDETTEKFLLGYAPSEWSALSD